MKAATSLSLFSENVKREDSDSQPMKWALLGLLFASVLLLGCTQPAAPTATPEPTATPAGYASPTPSASVDPGVYSDVDASAQSFEDFELDSEVLAEGDIETADFDRLQ